LLIIYLFTGKVGIRRVYLWWVSPEENSWEN